MSNLLPVALRDHGLLGDEHLLGRNLDTHITPEKIILIPTDVFPKQWKIGDKSIKIQTLTEDLRFNLSKKKNLKFMLNQIVFFDLQNYIRHGYLI